MTRTEAQAKADSKKLGMIHFQFNTSRNGGRQFEVGYVFIEGRRELFCKRQPGTEENEFYLCNEFA